MADELTITAALRYESGVQRAAIVPAALVVDAGVAPHHTVQSVGTSEEAIALGDLLTLGTLGYAFFRNLDATNYVSIRAGTGETSLIRLQPGEWCVFPFDGAATAPYAIANTAAVNLEVCIFGD